MDIVPFNADLLQNVAAAFQSWNKTVEQYEGYLRENLTGARYTLVACESGKVLGYGNLIWSSYFQPFSRAGIPEINDLNVITARQGQGIGTRIIEELEAYAKKSGHGIVGIGVGLEPGYERAQRLYPYLGYVPDGSGITKSPWGKEIHFIKRL